MLTGVGFNLRDKRIDKMLRSAGIINADIYYSPISSWLILLLLLLPSGFWVLYSISFSAYWYFLVLYFLVSYLINAYRSNSFALHHGKLIVVNPNFPFRKVKAIPSSSIGLITIDQLKTDWLMIFIQIGSNYLHIKTNEREMRYYCSGLEVDGFDENWIEKTIDMLEIRLRQEGIKTNLKL